MRRVTVHQFKVETDGSVVHTPTGMRIEFYDRFGHPIVRTHRTFARDGHLANKASEPEASGFVREEIESMALRFARRQRVKRPAPQARQ